MGDIFNIFFIKKFLGIVLHFGSDFTIMATGKNQGWAWKHFYTDKKNYKTDKTHYNAWCLAELKFKVETLRESDNDTFNQSLITAKRTDSELWVKGKHLFSMS